MIRTISVLASVVFMVILVTSFSAKPFAGEDNLLGAWQRTEDSKEEIIVFMDGYFTHTIFDKKNRQFVQTRGGTYTRDHKALSVMVEFDTKNKEAIGQTVIYTVSVTNRTMTTTINAEAETWQRVDDGREGLSGLWTITARRQEGNLVPIHQSGTRKTIKILTGTRFQWAAIDPGTKSFMGTGGGSYTFRDGKYTENIEFFSRDSSRVGSALSFDGKLQNGDWHHSGLSSKGDPIYEVWSRKNGAVK